MLGDPITRESPLLGVSGEIDGVTECLGDGASLANGSEIEDREAWCHAFLDVLAGAEGACKGME
jgi:hypothetical protein